MEYCLGIGRQVPLLQQARELQASPAFDEIRQRRQVVEHRIARLVQLGIRQARYVGRTKTLFQLGLAAAVANLTLSGNSTFDLSYPGGLPSGDYVLIDYNNTLPLSYSMINFMPGSPVTGSLIPTDPGQIIVLSLSPDPVLSDSAETPAAADAIA